MILEQTRDILADRPADDRLARTVHRFAIAANEIMPVGQGLALGAPAIGAALWQPFEVFDFCPRQRQAVGNMAAAMLVIAPPRGRKVAQAPRDLVRQESARIILLPLVTSPLDRKHGV